MEETRLRWTQAGFPSPGASTDTGRSGPSCDVHFRPPASIQPAIGSGVPGVAAGTNTGAGNNGDGSRGDNSGDGNRGDGSRGDNSQEPDREAQTAGLLSAERLIRRQIDGATGVEFNSRWIGLFLTSAVAIEPPLGAFFYGSRSSGATV